jgi:hypothetical protein
MEENSSKIITNNIITIFNSSDFWVNLIGLKHIFYLYCLILNILQKDKAQLYNVLYVFWIFYTSIN